MRTGLVEDVYLTLVSAPASQQVITLGVRINPMIVWLWVGGGFMALGTILALSPRLRRRSRPRPAADAASEPEPEPRDPEPREEVSV